MVSVKTVCLSVWRQDSPWRSCQCIAGPHIHIVSECLMDSCQVSTLAHDCDDCDTFLRLYESNMLNFYCLKRKYWTFSQHNFLRYWIFLWAESHNHQNQNKKDLHIVCNELRKRQFHHGLGFLEPPKGSNLGTNVFNWPQFIANICPLLKLLYINV